MDKSICSFDPLKIAQICQTYLKFIVWVGQIKNTLYKKKDLKLVLPCLMTINQSNKLGKSIVEVYEIVFGVFLSYFNGI